MATEAILGISPGTRSIGVAVIRDGRLQHWRIHSFPGPWSNKKLRYIQNTLVRYMVRFDVSVMAIKVPDKFPNSTGYNQLIGGINVICERRQILSNYYTLKDLKIEFSGGTQASRNELLKDIVGKYPELLPEFRKENENANSYFFRLFEAVGVATIQ